MISTSNSSPGREPVTEWISSKLTLPLKLTPILWCIFGLHFYLHPAGPPIEEGYRSFRPGVGELIAGGFLVLGFAIQVITTGSLLKVGIRQSGDQQQIVISNWRKTEIVSPRDIIFIEDLMWFTMRPCVLKKSYPGVFGKWIQFTPRVCLHTGLTGPHPDVEKLKSLVAQAKIEINEERRGRH